MTPEEAARDSADAVAHIATGFMLDANTYMRGAELGYPGSSFYFVGRGGALGDVDADVVTAAFVFFNPETVRQAWADAAAAPPPTQAALEFAACGHAWAEEHMGDDVDLDRLAELSGAIISSANPAGAPVFAGWRNLPEPASVKALVLHRFNALRELRGAMHGAAVLSTGLDPAVAVAIKTAFMLPIFGWTDEPEVTAEASEAWQRAEDATNLMMAPHLAALDEQQLDEWVTLGAAVLAGMR